MKFGYWKIQGLGQPIRYLIAAANLTEIEQVDYTEFDQWFKEGKPEVAKKSFFPNLPYLEIKNGSVAITQSRAVLAYLGRSSKFCAANEEETLRIDVINGALDDIWQKFMRLMFDKENFDSNKQKVHDEILPMLQNVDNYFQKHKYCSGNRAASWLDFKALHFFNILFKFSGKFAACENIEKFLQNLLGEFDTVRKCVEENDKGRPFMPPGFGAWKYSGGPPGEMVREF